MILQNTIGVEIDTLHIKNKINERYNLNCNVGDTIEIPWRDIRKTKHRKKKILISCDECDKQFYRQIRDINDDSNLCKSCSKKGNRNPAFGKKLTKEHKNLISNSLRGNNNPSKRPDVREKLRNNYLNIKHKFTMKNKHHSKATKDKMSKIALQQFKNGERKVSSGWGNVKIKQYKGIDYQSTYELKFLKYIESLNLLHVVERGPTISYKIDNIEHSYFSDYKIKNTNMVVEIKSKYMWKKHIEVNMIKKQYAEKLYDYIIIMDNNFSKITNKIKKITYEKI